MYGYNPYLINQAQTSFNQAQPSFNQDERIWVQNRASADAYLVAPNSFVRLWDSNANVFYEKRADATGRPYPIDTYEYKRIEPQIEPKLSEVSNSMQEEIKRLNERITKLERGVFKRESESYANDTNVQPISKELQRESRTGRQEPSSFWKDEPSPAEPITADGDTAPADTN